MPLQWVITLPTQFLDFKTSWGNDRWRNVEAQETPKYEHTPKYDHRGPEYATPKYTSLAVLSCCFCIKKYTVPVLPVLKSTCIKKRTAEYKFSYLRDFLIA